MGHRSHTAGYSCTDSLLLPSETVWNEHELPFRAHAALRESERAAVIWHRWLDLHLGSAHEISSLLRSVIVCKVGNAGQVMYKVLRSYKHKF